MIAQHSIPTDEATFSELVDRHRRELQLHCYRMLGSFEESEDLLQETLLRAWRKRESFEGRSTFRAWLYKIATNACLDALARTPRAVVHEEGGFEVPWLQPYPDELLHGIPADEAEPDDAVVAKETIELAFMVAIQHLPPRQRAVLILRGVLDWPAKDTAAALDASVASVNSALQRARAALKERLPERRLEWSSPEASEEERELLRRYVEASERADADAIAELLAEDVHFAMPPEPFQATGRRAVVDSWVSGGFGTEEFRDWRGKVVWLNRQPAIAWYLRRPGESAHKAFAIDVLRVDDGAIGQVMTFSGASLFDALRLPSTM